MWSTSKNKITTAQRAVLSSLAALVLATALPQASFAAPQSEAGLWKVTQSRIGTRSGTIVIQRVRTGEAVGSGDTFLVISKGKAYLATPENTSSTGGARAVDYKAWSDMKLEPIGTNVRAVIDCASRCQHGFSGDRMTVTFKTVKKQPSGVVALDQKKE